jgi:hypothetical protein
VVTMNELPYKSLEGGRAAIQQDEKLCERKNMRRLVMPFMCLIFVCVITWTLFPVLDLNYRLPMHESEFSGKNNFTDFSSPKIKNI